MHILIVAATIQEIEPSLPFLEQKRIPYLITGVGMVAATYAITKALQKQSFGLVIQVGIAGILDQKASLGDVYRIVEDAVFDLGAEDKADFIAIDQLGFGKSIYRERIKTASLTIPETKEAIGITVNKVHGRLESVERLRRMYSQPLVESMEGVSAFFVAEQEETDVLQFRAISNYIEPRNRASWQIGLAVKNLNQFLEKLLMSL